MYLLRLYLVCFFSVTQLFAQKEAYNWFFGDQAGITFNTNPPSAVTKGKMYTNEGCASISASNGRLLFYTDGIDVWDSTHNTMPNGYGLKGSATSTQSAIIVPKPNDPQVYYIFTVAPEGVANGLQYSELDMKLNSGKGDIVSGKKNIKLKSPVCEKVTAVQKKNLNEYWVLALRFKSDSFFAYSVTSLGVNMVPTGYATGFSIFGAGTNAIGYLKVSANSKKIAYANSTFDTAVIADFDANTAKISNLWKFYSRKGYGIEFSPNSRFLYMSEEGNKRIFQYDLASTSKSAFIASKRTVDSGYAYSPAALQIGPDGKIYISSVNDQYLSVIQSPDSFNCRPQKNYLYLKGRYSHYGLPAFIKTFFQDTNFIVKKLCVNDSTSFFISFDYTLDSVLWNFGDPGSTNNTFSSLNGAYHIYKKNGKYTVTLTTYRNGVKKIYKLDIKIHGSVKPFLGNDTSFCNTFTKILKPQRNYKSYLWPANGGTSDTIHISKKGSYILNVKDSGDCPLSDTIVILNPLAKAGFIISDSTQCLKGNNFKLTNTSFYTGNHQIKSVWKFNDGTRDTNGIASKQYSFSGIYNARLVIESNEHCRDSINISLTVFPEVNIFIGNDTSYCGKFSRLLKASTSFSKYRWSTGETSPQITVQSKGVYSVDANDINDCQSSDTIRIENVIIPEDDISIDYDPVDCDYIYLKTDSVNGETFLWNTGESTSKIKAFKTGWYSVRKNLLYCGIKDSILVDRLAQPVVDLGPDTSLCTYDIILNTDEPGTYLWNTSETSHSIYLNKTGTYWLTVTRNHCTASDTVNVKICEKMTYYVPEIFTPNDDNLNDVFRVYGSNIKYVEMEIYNRWGEKILEVSGKDPSWDGRFKDEVCMDGVYFYKLVVKGLKAGSVTNLKGSVTLVR